MFPSERDDLLHYIHYMYGAYDAWRLLFILKDIRFIVVINDCLKHQQCQDGFAFV